MTYRILWLIVGLPSIGAGILALASRFTATLTAETFAGYIFLLIGVLTLVTGVQLALDRRAPVTANA